MRTATELAQINAMFTVVTSGAGDADSIHGDAGDDIVFGGLGNDFIHGGSGDDAIAGGEALTESYSVRIKGSFLRC